MASKDAFDVAWASQFESLICLRICVPPVGSWAYSLNFSQGA